MYQNEDGYKVLKDNTYIFEYAVPIIVLHWGNVRIAVNLYYSETLYKSCGSMDMTSCVLFNVAIINRSAFSVYDIPDITHRLNNTVNVCKT